MKNNEENLHWSEEKEIVKSNRPIKLIFSLLKHLPSSVVVFFVYSIGFFYFIFSKRARTECQRYQKNLKAFTDNQIPKHRSSYRQIVSFSLCIVEKIEGWIGKFVCKNIILNQEGYCDFAKQINEGHGAVLIGSHLGNIELLRSFYQAGKSDLKRNVPVTAIMEMKTNENFTRTMKEINPDFNLNIIDPGEISPDTMIELTEKIENGEIIVFTGDRTSARNRSRVIRDKFLGKPADFPYGVFLLAALLNAPTYYFFGLRTKIFTLHPKYNMFVEKSSIKFDCNRSERDIRIKLLCHEFIEKLEKYCKLYPYQWYNFYNFWLLNENSAE